MQILPHLHSRRLELDAALRLLLMRAFLHMHVGAMAEPPKNVWSMCAQLAAKISNDSSVHCQTMA